MLQWWSIISAILPVVIGAIVGGSATFLGSYYLWKQQQEKEFKNIANALVIDLERIYNSNYAWWNIYKNKRYPPGLNENSIMPPDNSFYDKNSLYFIFTHDIFMYDYSLSSQIYAFYSKLLDIESERKYVIKNRDAEDPIRRMLAREFYNSMKSGIISTEEQILGLRQQLKEIIGDSTS